MSDTEKKAAQNPRAIPGTRVHKRPLLRQQPSASATRPLIYVSSTTPFMSAAQRVRKLLARSQCATAPAAPKNASLQSRIDALQHAPPSAAAGTQVTVVGAGRAVEKVVALAAWFEQRGEYVVQVRTRTVGAVDDVVRDDEETARVRRLSSLELVVGLK